MTVHSSFVAVAPFSSDISFKPFFVLCDSFSFPPEPFYFVPSAPIDFVVGIGHERVIVLSKSLNAEKLPSEFLEFCENFALGRSFTKDKNVTH